MAIGDNAKIDQMNAKTRIYNMQADEAQRGIAERNRLQSTYQRLYQPGQDAVAPSTAEIVGQNEDGGTVYEGGFRDAQPATEGGVMPKEFINAVVQAGGDPITAREYLTKIDRGQLDAGIQADEKHIGMLAAGLAEYHDNVPKIGAERAAQKFSAQVDAAAEAEGLDINTLGSQLGGDIRNPMMAANVMGKAKKHLDVLKTFQAGFKQSIPLQAAQVREAGKTARVSQKEDRDTKVKEVLAPYQKWATDDPERYDIASQTAEEGIDQGMTPVQVNALISRKVADMDKAMIEEAKAKKQSGGILQWLGIKGNNAQAVTEGSVELPAAAIQSVQRKHGPNYSGMVTFGNGKKVMFKNGRPVK